MKSYPRNIYINTITTSAHNLTINKNQKSSQSVLTNLTSERVSSFLTAHQHNPTRHRIRHILKLMGTAQGSAKFCNTNQLMCPEILSHLE